MNSFTKQSSKTSSPPKVKSHQVSATSTVKANANSSISNCCENNDGASLLGIMEGKEILQQVHPMVHSSAELAGEPPSTPPSIHPAAHRPSSLTTQSASSSVSGGIYTNLH